MVCEFEGTVRGKPLVFADDFQDDDVDLIRKLIPYIRGLEERCHRAASAWTDDPHDAGVDLMRIEHGITDDDLEGWGV